MNPNKPKTQQRLLWAAILLLALAFGAAGSAKLAGATQMVAIFEQIGFGQNFRLFTGVIELLGVVLLLLPVSRFFGALWLGGSMLGAIATHLLLIGGSPLPAMLLGALAAWVAFAARPQALRRSVQ